MDAVIVVWWVALIGALVLTVIAIAEIVRIVHHAREIDRLAKTALPAAERIAANTAVLTELAGVRRSVERIGAAIETLDRGAAAIEGRVAALGRALRRAGGA